MDITSNDQLQKVIFDTMASFVNKESIDKNKVTEAIKILEKISDLFQLDEAKYPNVRTYYSSKKGFMEELYYIKSKDNYTEALTLINQFLDILRGTPIELLVMEITHDLDGNVSSIKTFQGKESDVELKRRTEKNFKNHVDYLKESLKEQHEMDEKFKKDIEYLRKINDEFNQ